MTKEDKELLLKDLSARLLYGVKVSLGKEVCSLLGIKGDKVYLDVDTSSFDVDSIIPYLRPMSDMTEEEKEEHDALYTYVDDCIQSKFKIDFSIATDWFNKHHFDFRGLIPMGLALPATKDMYNIKDK